MADVDNQICETVYGTQDDSHVMSDRVQTLASSIYKEFERMIKSYDENVVKELMPLVVGILEGLDQSYQEKQETDVELELLRDDNEQLLTQYEREKQLRKGTEQKYLEVEDAHDEERKDLTSKVETLESGVRMFELKAKNAQDHVTRLEDKEGEMKKEYSKLHERYTELFRTHMDYMERTKLLMGGDKIMDTGVSPRSRGGMLLPNLKPGPGSFIYNSGETPVKPSSSPPSFSITSPPSGTDSNRSLKHELKDLEKGEAEEKLGSKENKEMRNKHSARAETADKEQLTDSIQMRERSSGTIEETAAKTESESESKSESKDTSEQTLTAGDSADIKQESCDHIDKRTADDESGHRGVDMDREEENTTSDSAEMIEPIFELDEPYSYRESFPGDTMMQSPELEDIDDSTFQQAAHASPVHIAGASKKPQNESSLFEELSVEDADALGEMDDGCDITGSIVQPGDYSSSETEQENDKLSSGMSKEVENLILENTELLATKNALNVVKDDLIAKVDELSSEQEILREEINSLQTVKENLKKKVSELEVELKKTREELEKEKHRKTAENDEEEEVPMAQRKRFTRVEMARVLMERNQYKERLMELQEAVRWTEMIRASREHPDLVQSKKKGSIWNFFSNLFSTEKPRKRPITSTSLKYSAPTTQVRPIGDPNKKQRDKYNLGEKAKAYDFLQDDILADKARKEREKERREQYKQVRAHVKKDDGRMQAYGWSLPAKYNPPTTKDAPAKSLVPVPVPVYCRPLLEQEEGMKLWCAAGVNLSGGRTKDGGSVVGASVFYSNPPESTTAQPSSTEVDKLDQELKEHENGLQALQNQQISSLAWICTTTHNSSHVSVVDANNPGDILEIFHVTSSHILCIASVPGAMESDYPSDGEDIKVDPEGSRPSKLDTASTASSTSAGGEDANDLSSIGGISFVQCAMGGTAGEDEEEDEDDEEDGQVASAHQPAPDSGGAANGGSSDETEAPGAPKCAPVDQGASSSASPPPPDGAPCDAECGVYDDEVKVSRATGSPASSAQSTPSHRPSGGEGGDKSRILDAASELVRDGINAVSSDNGLMYQEAGKMSSVQATMWLGCQSGSLYVHSAVSQWKRCLHSVKLKDSALGIIHVKGRVFVALADGTVAVFHRAADGQWDLTNYHVVDLGQPQHSIRCMCVVANKQVWCGYRNKIHVLDPKTLVLEKTFDAHPRKESQVRQLAWVGDGVWVSIRLDSTLRLYHAYTHQHLQDVDIEPYVSKMLGTGKLGFSFVRITSLLISCNRLWIGTGNGVIISVPLSESNRQCVTTSTAGRPGGVIRVYTDARTDSVTPGSFIPYCSMAQAQLSFHGHRDAVKFFVAVPGAPSKGVSGVLSTKETKDKGDGDSASDSKAPKKTMLVMSGGEGYIDFRLGDTEEDGEVEDEKKAISKGEKSHLIVWHLSGYW